MINLYYIGLRCFSKSDKKEMSVEDKRARREHLWNLAGAAVGMFKDGTAGFNNLKDLKEQHPHFTVIYRTEHGVGHKSLKADTPLEATEKATKGLTNATDVRAFRIPEQEDESQDYYYRLKSVK